LEVRHGLDKLGETGEPVVAGGEARDGLGALAELGEGRVAFFVALRSLVCGAEYLKQLRIDGALALAGGRLLQFLVLQSERADVEKARAGLLEGNGRLGRAETVDV